MAEIVGVLTGVRTYLLRRRVLGITQAENRFFPVLGGRVPELEGTADIRVALFEHLSSQEYALRLPNDDEMTARLRAMNFYNLGRSRNYPRLLLSLIEESFTKSRPIWDDSTLQLEHIMPQKINADWREELGDDFEVIHQEFVNNVGNITLIRHNQELGNKSFAEKKSTYAGKSGLQVTQNCVLDRESWDQSAIERRRDYVIDILMQKILEIPASFKRGSNWNQNERGSSQFDAREILNQLIGSTIEFVPNPSITAEVVSDSKVAFEGKEWSLGPLTTALKQRSGSVSKGSNFHGASNWSWDGTRLVDLDL